MCGVYSCPRCSSANIPPSAPLPWEMTGPKDPGGISSWLLLHAGSLNRRNGCLWFQMNTKREGGEAQCCSPPAHVHFRTCCRNMAAESCGQRCCILPCDELLSRVRRLCSLLLSCHIMGTFLLPSSVAGGGGQCGKYCRSHNVPSEPLPHCWSHSSQQWQCARDTGSGKHVCVAVATWNGSGCEGLLKRSIAVLEVLSPLPHSGYAAVAAT